MSRRQLDPLRPLTAEERGWLARISLSHSEPAAHVARATMLLAVAAGQSYTIAAHAAGRRSGDAVAHLVSRFNHDGVAGVETRHGGGAANRGPGGGRPTVYTSAERDRILAEARRSPDPSGAGNGHKRSRQRRHVLGGSGACKRQPLRRPHATVLQQWRSASQMTH